MNSLSVMLRALLLALPSALATTALHVDCDKGLDSALGTVAAPFRTVQRAQLALRTLRAGKSSAAEAAEAVVHINGVCELAETLTLGPADGHTRYVGGGGGAMLSAGTRIVLPSTNPQAAAASPLVVDLTKFGFTSATLGKLSGRGYSGGSACILVQNFESSAAELFYRPHGASSAAGARAYGPAQLGGMWNARSPNRAPGGLPAASDWAGISTVDNLTLTADAFASQLPAWQAEMAKGGTLFMHGLWAWNWADSHRPVLAIAGSNITVGADDINRDVNPIHA